MGEQFCGYILIDKKLTTSVCPERTIQIQDMHECWEMEMLSRNDSKSATVQFKITCSLRPLVNCHIRELPNLHFSTPSATSSSSITKCCSSILPMSDFHHSLLDSERSIQLFWASVGPLPLINFRLHLLCVSAQDANFESGKLWHLYVPKVTYFFYSRLHFIYLFMTPLSVVSVSLIFISYSHFVWLNPFS